MRKKKLIKRCQTGAETQKPKAAGEVKTKNSNGNKQIRPGNTWSPEERKIGWKNYGYRTLEDGRVEETASNYETAVKNMYGNISDFNRGEPMYADTILFTKPSIKHNVAANTSMYNLHDVVMAKKKFNIEQMFSTLRNKFFTPNK